MQDPLINLNANLKYRPNDPTLYVDRGAVYFQRGQLDSAILDLRTAIRLDTFAPNPNYRAKLAFYFYTQQQDDSAEKWYLTAFDLNSESAETFYQYGNLLTVKGKYNEAITYYNSAIELEPNDPHYYFGKGYAIRQAGYPNDARTYYLQALDKDPQFIKALAELVDLYQQDLNDPMRANEYLNLLLAADSLHPVGNFLKAQALVAESQPSQDAAAFKLARNNAIYHYTLALRRDPGFTNARYGRGYAFFELEQFDQAMTDFKAVANQNPNDFRAQFMLGSLYEVFQDDEAAVKHYRKALELKPNFPEAHQALAELGG